jgi:hypothetical protein
VDCRIGSSGAMNPTLGMMSSAASGTSLSGAAQTPGAVWLGS